VTELYAHRADLAPVEDVDDIPANPSTAPLFADVVQARLSRRSVLTGGMLAAAGFMTTRLVADSPSAYAAGARTQAPPANAQGLLGYSPIPLGFEDEVVVPPGYTARPLIPWGTPITGSLPAFEPGTPGAPQNEMRGGNTAAEQAQQTGMHHDGMHFFSLGDPGRPGSRSRKRGVLVVNHEYTDESYLHTGRYIAEIPDEDNEGEVLGYTQANRDRWTPEMVRKSQAAHGVSVVTVRQAAGSKTWEETRSRLNRRITANTSMAFSGPAAGHRLLRTSADPQGRRPRGTINNCSHGYTPWGTYLACEENFNNYFSLETTEGSNPLAKYTAEQQAMLKRYGGFDDEFYNWSTHDPRFRVTPQEAQRAEPLRLGRRDRPLPPRLHPGQAHRARSPEARGRLRPRHEAQPRRRLHGRRPGQRLRLQVRRQRQLEERLVQRPQPAGRRHAVRRQVQRRRHRRVVAPRARHRAADGGQRLRRPGRRAGQDPARLRRAGRHPDGPSRVDDGRPDHRHGLPDPHQQLRSHGDQRPEPAAVIGNPFGQIVRWEEAGNDHAATTFAWELFLLAGQGRDSGDESTIQKQDAFGSPDGMWVDPGQPGVDPDRRQPAGGRQRPDARGEPLRHRLGGCTGDQALPHRRHRVRGHGSHHDARPADDVHQHPAPG
jgi:hypothetical protein